MPDFKGTATFDNLFAAAETRLSCYTLSDESTIPDTRIHEIVNAAVKHAPSSFNVQSARAVILVKDDHQALWDLADRAVKSSTEEKNHEFLQKMVSGFRKAYGSVLWFEDKDALDGLAAKNPLFGHLVPEWADSSSGMHQFLVWTALELEGMGCNLQHFNFIPEFAEEVLKHWNLPKQWIFKSQLVFGKPTDGLKRGKERTYAPLADRVMIFGSEGPS